MLQWYQNIIYKDETTNNKGIIINKKGETSQKKVLLGKRGENEKHNYT